MTLADLRKWAADDFLAATHQSMGQYRTALLRAIDETIAAPSLPAGDGLTTDSLSAALWDAFCNILQGAEYDENIHVYLSERQLAGCVERVLESSIPQRQAAGDRLTDERELDLYDEIECDLPALFGHASLEGHEAGQRLAKQVQEKMRRARDQSADLSEDTEAVIACLGDDAAMLRDEHPEVADNMDRAAELLAAPRQPGEVGAGVPNGWKLVPVTPTADQLCEMMSDGEKDAAIGMSPEHRALLIERAGIADRYEAMLEASPQHQSAFMPAARSKLKVFYGPMPESNGKSNYTAILYRDNGNDLLDIVDGITLDRSEFPDRVRYEADRVRFLIGELAERPDILAYDADKHSGYAETASAQQDEPGICPKCHRPNDEYCFECIPGRAAQQDEREAEAWLMELCSAWDFGIPGAAFGDIVRRIAAAQQVQADAGAVAWRREAYPLDVRVTEVERDCWIEQGWAVQPLYLHPVAESDKRDMDEFKQAADEIQDCGESGAPYEKFLQWAIRGLLLCTKFELTAAGRAAMSREQSGGGE